MRSIPSHEFVTVPHRASGLFLPLFGCSVPLAILASLWQPLLERFGGIFRLGAVDLRLQVRVRVLLAEIHLDGIIALPVVDNYAGERIALSGVAFKPLLTGQFPWSGS